MYDNDDYLAQAPEERTKKPSFFQDDIESMAMVALIGICAVAGIFAIGILMWGLS